MNPGQREDRDNNEQYGQAEGIDVPPQPNEGREPFAEREPEQEPRVRTQPRSVDISKDMKKEIALAVLTNMDSGTQTDVVRQLKLLPEEDRRSIANSLMPTQPVTDWIWKVTVGVFAFVFVIATFALCAGELWFGGDVQTLLTVVTTVAGILAGFISGRASTGGTAS